MMSTLLNLKMAGLAAAQEAADTDEGKSLVCVFLAGGMDSFNMLIPHEQSAYEAYASARGGYNSATDGVVGEFNPAVDPVTGAAALHLFREGDSAYGDVQRERQSLSLNHADALLPAFGVHGACSKFQELYNGYGGDDTKRRLAFVSNVGTLIQPTTMTQYQNESVSLPKALFSHSDQQEQWMTSVPQGLTNLAGWGGRMADILHSTHNVEPKTSMNISLGGNNIFQIGQDVQQFVISNSGALTFSNEVNYEGNLGHTRGIKHGGADSLLAATYRHQMEQAFASHTKASVEAQSYFQDEFDTEDTPSAFSGSLTWFERNLLAATKTIALREKLGLKRQTIFIIYGGWDHHFELIETQDSMLNGLSEGLYKFQSALEEKGLADSTVTFSATEFARTLRPNRAGTDHAWGGNQFVMGGPVDGGKVFGTYPDLSIDGPDDVGRAGRMLPTLSADEYFAELLRWFGVNSSTDLSYVLPNIGNFWEYNPNQMPVGFLNPQV